MTAYLPDPAQLSVFLTASLLLGLTPGPDMLLVVSRSVGLGFREGIVTLLGISAGGVVHILAAAFGLSLLLIEFPLLYDVIRYAGAAYLIWMAFQIARSGGGIDLTASSSRADSRTLFLQATLTNLLNPKVALFMLAFLPQFVPSDAANPAARMIVLGAIFIGMGLIIMMTLAAFAGRIRPWLLARPVALKAQAGVTGLLLAGFATYLALDSRR